MNAEPSLFGPQRVAVQLEESTTLEFLSYWVQYDKPMPLTFQKAKTPGIVAVTFTIDPADYTAMEFMERAVSKTGGRVWNLTKPQK
jgi:hypothetical protein